MAPTLQIGSWLTIMNNLEKMDACHPTEASLAMWNGRTLTPTYPNLPDGNWKDEDGTIFDYTDMVKYGAKFYKPIIEDVYGFGGWLYKRIDKEWNIKMVDSGWCPAYPGTCAMLDTIEKLGGFDEELNDWIGEWEDTSIHETDELEFQIMERLIKLRNGK